MSENNYEDNGEITAINGSGRCDSPYFAFGTAHPVLQQYDCLAHGLSSLLQLLPTSYNPFCNWSVPQEYVVDPEKVLTWFPNDTDHVVFYTGGEDREALSYADLHEQVGKCPPYASKRMVVAVLLPHCLMAEMAVTIVSLLCRGVCVAPLDPNLPRPKLLEALSQLQCNGLVATQEFLNHLQWDQEPSEEVLKSLEDVRIIEPTAANKAGAVNWTVVCQIQRADNFDDAGLGEYPSLLLRTSGTTSTPKVVPITATALLFNATCLAASLRLRRNDVGCNAMPLFHIGGIACALLAVLVSGSSVIMLPGPFDPQTFLDFITMAGSEEPAAPTWYYAAPTLHKALLVTGKARLLQNSSSFLPNKLRFIRSGTDHLSHETAVELSSLFRTQVIPTYSMSECMPICSSTDAIVWDRPTQVIDTVGPAIGCSMCIINQAGETMAYDDENTGEVALRGAGVLQAYRGIPRDTTHTPDGWLRTGDIGYLDRQGRLFLKGRVKEMIKRGGEQVWPCEVDRVVEQVLGVATGVTFGVSNDLWGEEVAVAVILDSGAENHTAMTRSIQTACKEQLSSAAVPCQIVFVESTEQLLKGPTGKYLRTQLASHLGVTSTDTGALHALEAAGIALSSSLVQKDASPSPALNGVRFLTACFVVQHHIGLYPNNAWLRIQTFSLNMQIFFMLGAFQLACSVKSEVQSSWSQFVGTKIGAMHALFVVTQFIALASYLIFQCGPDGYQETFENSSCSDSGFLAFTTIAFVVATVTGLLGVANVVNSVAWFQSVFYVFLLMFPSFDKSFRNRTTRGLIWILVANLLIATFVILGLFLIGLWFLNFTILSWLPALVAAMIAGYFFVKFSPATDQEHEQEQHRIRAACFFQRPCAWGVVADLLSLIFIVFEVIVSLSPDCVWVEKDTFMEMRPGEELPEDDMFVDDKNYVYACDVAYDEFVEFVHANEDNINNGRWPTEFGGIVGFSRLGTPLVLLWLFAVAHGCGLTALLMKSHVLQVLAPVTYPLYLLHVPIGRIYWVATRGLKAEHWWNKASLFPIPVEWYEVLIIIAICLVLGSAIDRFILPHLVPYTVKVGVFVCRSLSKCCGNRGQVQDSSSSSSLEQVESLVKGLTGNEISRSTNLRDLGLDSLGATALLGTLRASVPAAKKLTLQQLAEFETVDELVDFLDSERDIEEDVV